MSDGNLRQIFRQYLPEAMWQPVETFSTGRGVPDVHYCFPGGHTGWIENKRTTGWAVTIAPEQGAWLDRYSRNGGRCFIAVRRQGAARGQTRDELWLFDGAQARALMEHGLKLTPSLGQYPHGPQKWLWDEIRKILISP